MDEPQYTGDDLDALVELQASAGFALFMGKVEAELERRRMELERPAGEKETAETRGRIAALRTVKHLPSILQQEIHAAIQEEERGR